MNSTKWIVGLLGTIVVIMVFVAVQVYALGRSQTALKISLGSASAYKNTPTPTPYPAATNNPIITDILPSSGKPGTKVVISGGPFQPSGNTILFQQFALQNISSPDGKTLKFAVPNQLVDCYKNLPYFNHYLPLCNIVSTTTFMKTLNVTVQVVSGNGLISNAAPFGNLKK